MTISQYKAGASLLALLLLTQLLLPMSAKAQEGASVVRGVVKGTNGEALHGASVIIRNEKNKFTLGTRTDSSGVFTFPRVPAGGPYSFSFSTVGYESQTLSGYTIKEGTTFTLAVDMKTSASTLDQVVVIGYGAVKKSNLTGTVTSVRPEELKKVPATNVMEAIQGKVPGVDITRSSGSAGAKANVSVRGNRSLTASNQPLYIVDGIQYSNFEDLNSNDIQSMEVLKDAASTAIYGSRGANGVIIITTRKGKTGQPRISVNTYAGASEIFGYPNVQSPEEFRQFRREANRTIGKWNSSADDVALFGNLLNSKGVVWKDHLIHNGSQKDVQVGVSAGNEKTNFYVSLDYFNEKGIFKNDELNRYSARVNADYTLSKRLKIGTQNQLTYYLQDIRRDALGASNGLNPLELPYDSAGNLIQLLNNGRSVNPLMEEVPGNYENNNRTARVFNSAYLEFTPVKNLTFRSNMGVTITNSRDGLYAGMYTTERNGAKPLSRYVNGNSANLNLENVLNYSKTFNDHALTITAVQSYLTNRAELITGQGTNQLLAYQSFYGMANANEEVSTSTAFIKSSLVSGAGRVQYGFKEKYLLMLTGHPRGGNNGHLHFCMTYERAAAGAIGMQRDVANGRPFAWYMPSKFLLNLFDETRDSRYDATFKQAWICNRAGTYDKKVGANTIKVTLAVGDTAMLATKYEVPDAVDATKKYLVIDESKMYKPDGKIAANFLYIQFRKFDDPTRPSANEVQSARDVFVLRLAEMYLIAAEAELKLGRLSDAATDINVIRTRAAQPGQTAAMQVTASDITLDFILDERARELAGEQLRWFDLKRTGKLVERVRKYNPEAATYIKDYHVLRPIPQKQMDAVVNKTEFIQNDGYK